MGVGPSVVEYKGDSAGEPEVKGHTEGEKSLFQYVKAKQTCVLSLFFLFRDNGLSRLEEEEIEKKLSQWTFWVL